MKDRRVVASAQNDQNLRVLSDEVRIRSLLINHRRNAVNRLLASKRRNAVSLHRNASRRHVVNHRKGASHQPDLRVPTMTIGHHVPNRRVLNHRVLSQRALNPHGRSRLVRNHHGQSRRVQNHHGQNRRDLNRADLNRARNRLVIRIQVDRRSLIARDDVSAGVEGVPACSFSFLGLGG